MIPTTPVTASEHVEYQVTYQGGQCLTCSSKAEASSYIESGVATGLERADYAIEHRRVTVSKWYPTTALASLEPRGTA
jgi:hypothetical protein